MSSTRADTPPAGPVLAGSTCDDPAPGGSVRSEAVSGQEAHFRALESLYRAAPINHLFASQIAILGPGKCDIWFDVDERHFHAAGAVHGSAYFKMLDDAAFYAVNSLVTDRFVLTTAFNLLFTRPIRPGRLRATGRWLSGRKRVYVGEARLLDEDGEEAGRGTGTFMRSSIPLAGLPGYAAP